MSAQRDQLEQWLRAAREDEHLEFKEAKRSFDFDKLLDYCVALANEGGGKLILGVSNGPPRRVVGTTVFPSAQDVREKIFNSSRRRVEVDEIQHPDGRVLLFTVPSRPIGMPLERDGRFLMRVGENLVAMSPDQLQRILAEAQPDYTAETVPGLSFDAIDDQAFASFRQQWIRKANNSRLGSLPAKQLLSDSGLMIDGCLTLAALILLGRSEALARHLPQTEVIFEYRSSDTSTSHQQRLEFRRGFFGFYEELWGVINLRNDRQSYQDGLFRLEIPTLNETVVREALLNAVSHRDYRLGSSVFVRQFPRRLEIVSPGGFPPGITPENILDRHIPRNRKIAEALQHCGLVERSGQGMNRMFEESLKQGKAIPDFAGTDAYQVSVTVRGEIQHPAFVRFLEKLGTDRLEAFSTRDFLVLDCLHRGEAVPESMKDRMERLIDAGAIERVGRKFILSRALYADMGQRGVYTRRRGLDHETQKALLLTHIQQNAAEGSPLSELIQVLPQLGDRRVQLLLAELRREGRIYLSGKRRWARWYPGRRTQTVQR